MRVFIIRALLRALNTHFLNPTPCRYGFIGNVDAFSYGNLAAEVKRDPGVTVRTILEEADRFKSCPIRKDGGLTVVESDGTSREATADDIQDLQAWLTKPNEK